MAGILDMLGLTGGYGNGTAQPNVAGGPTPNYAPNQAPGSMTPLARSLLSGYFAGIGSPKLAGVSGAVSRGGLSALGEYDRARGQEADLAHNQAEIEAEKSRRSLAQQELQLRQAKAPSDISESESRAAFNKAHAAGEELQTKEAGKGTAVYKLDDSQPGPIEQFVPPGSTNIPEGYASFDYLRERDQKTYNAYNSLHNNWQTQRNKYEIDLRNSYEKNLSTLQKGKNLANGVSDSDWVQSKVDQGMKVYDNRIQEPQPPQSRIYHPNNPHLPGMSGDQNSAGANTAGGPPPPPLAAAVSTPGDAQNPDPAAKYINKY